MMLEKNELQKLIDKEEKKPEEMRIIGESYLRGDVLRDNTAAEAWLQKVIDSGDSKDSIIAMTLLARGIYGMDNIISEKDYRAMQEELNNCKEEEREKVKEMLDVIKGISV